MTNDWQPIDGETPVDDLSYLKNKSRKTRRQVAEDEAENIRKAVVKLLASKPSSRTAPFDYPWMLNVHRLMYGDVWTWAGEIRQIDLQLGISHALIGERLGGLALDIAHWDDKWPRIEQAAVIHYRAVHIHPFHNGNGRWSRLLANVWLRRHGLPMIEWPEPEIGHVESGIRTEYIAAIRTADEGNLQPLKELHIRFWPGASV
jgi:fido (protein-threonine AMPylation protein)